MFVLGDIFPNSGNVSGNGGILVSSGVFLSSDYGIAPLYSVPVYFHYGLRQISLSTLPNSGAPITGVNAITNPSGSYLLIDYGFAAIPSDIIQAEEPASTSVVFTIKPYGYFFRTK